MKTVKIEVKSAEAASRKELVIRFVWGAIAGMILSIIGFFAMIAWLVQFVHILATKKRHGALQKFMNSWNTARSQLLFYTMLSTDERPPLVPKF